MKYFTKIKSAGDFASVSLAQSFAKNFGLYGERVGMLHVVTGCASEATAVDAS